MLQPLYHEEDCQYL